MAINFDLFTVEQLETARARHAAQYEKDAKGGYLHMAQSAWEQMQTLDDVIAARKWAEDMATERDERNSQVDPHGDDLDNAIIEDLEGRWENVRDDRVKMLADILGIDLDKVAVDGATLIGYDTSRRAKPWVFVTKSGERRITTDEGARMKFGKPIAFVSREVAPPNIKLG